MQSYTYNQIVKVQLNVFDLNDNIKDDLTGEIQGYDEDLFYLDNGKKFHLSEVRNVAMVA